VEELKHQKNTKRFKEKTRRTTKNKTNHTHPGTEKSLKVKKEHWPMKKNQTGQVRRVNKAGKEKAEGLFRKINW